MPHDETPPHVTDRLRIVELFRPHWRTLAFALVAVLGETAGDVLGPWPIKIVVDNVVQSKPLPPWLGGIVSRLFAENHFAVLNFAVAAVAGIAVLGAISTYAEKYLTTNVSQWVAHDLRLTVYHHIQRLSLADHNNARTGDLLSRVTDDIGAVQDFTNSALLGILIDVLTLVGMIAIMLSVNWRFTLIALSVAPVLFFVVYGFTRRIKTASRAARKKESELVSDVSEVLTSIRVVQAFAREDYEDERFESESLDNVKTALEARSLKARLPPLVDIIIAIGTCLVLGYGARLALTGQITAGVLVVFLMYLSNMYKPMRDLSKMTDTVSKAAVGYERIREILDMESRVRDRADARKAPTFKGAIEFDAVSFGYEGQPTVLKDVSFAIEPGQVAALVGTSGAGKTTIASLIPRFYDPVSGIVKIDSVDIRQYTLKSLRDQISFVLQDSLLFHATIWENIAYGNPRATPREILRAAKLANAQEFIESMPQGYNTQIGERGSNLSGGQRQRIAIARAFVRNTPILIFDEPTASLDAASEEAVLEAMARLMAHRTSLVIAHRLDAIRHSDIIFVLQDAVLAEHGTHDELLARRGPYATLYDIQSHASQPTVQVGD